MLHFIIFVKIDEYVLLCCHHTVLNCFGALLRPTGVQNRLWDSARQGVLRYDVLCCDDVRYLFRVRVESVRDDDAARV
jgi:hypothetical protein